MASTAELIAQQKAALAVLNGKIQDAGVQQSAAAPGAEQGKWDGVVDDLTSQRDSLAAEIINNEMGDPALAAALAKLKAATDDMTAVAAQMTTLTTYLGKMADLLDATNDAIGALNG